MSRETSALRWAAALSNADWYVTGPLVSSLVNAWRTDVATVMTGVAFYTLGYGCALPLWGVAADRLGAGRALRLGLLLATAASAASAVCPGPSWWSAARLAAGASFAAVTPCVSLFCESAASARERHSAFAGITAASAATAVATPLLVALVIHAGSWRQAFALIALLAAATACRLRNGPPNRLSSAGLRCAPCAGGVAGRSTAAYGIVIAIGLGEGITLLTLPALLAPSLTLSGARAATCLAPALYAAGVWAGVALLERRCRTWRPSGLITLGGAAGTVGAGLIAALPGVPALLCGALMLGAAWSYLHTTLQTWLPRLLPSAVRARAASLFAASAMLASSATIPLSTSLLREGSRSAVFTSSALACAALTCLLMAVARRWRAAPTSVALSD